MIFSILLPFLKKKWRETANSLALMRTYKNIQYIPCLKRIFFLIILLSVQNACESFIGSEIGIGTSLNFPSVPPLACFSLEGGGVYNDCYHIVVNNHGLQHSLTLIAMPRHFGPFCVLFLRIRAAIPTHEILVMNRRTSSNSVEIDYRHVTNAKV